MRPTTGIGAAVASAAIVALAGCGGAGHTAAQRAQPAPAPFAWVAEAPASGWPRAALPSGGVSIPYPSGWRQIQSDAGTVTAATFGSRGEIAGYLNLTPQQGTEDLAGWARFRVGHNGHEGDRGDRVVAASEGLRFRTGRGSCVVDDYRTSKHAYREIACIVQGSRATTVAIGAAPPELWARQGPLLERAIAAIRT